jgi:MFS family permease
VIAKLAAGNRNREHRFMNQLRPIVCFALLTFVLLGLVPLVDFFVAAGEGNFAEIAERATEKTGLTWTSNLLVVVRMAVAEPALIGLLVGSMVPALAAVLTLVFIKRPNRWREFWGRLNPLRGTPVGTALANYGLIFVILVPTLLLVLYFRQSTGGQYTGGLSTLSLTTVLMVFGMAFLDQGAVLEELGWRGFAVPELQRTIDSSLRVAILVGIFWGFWHLPRDFTTGVVERLGVVDYVVLYLPSFLLGTISVSIIASYFMNRLGGSVIPAVMIHGITNDSVGISGSASIVEALTPYHQFTKNSLLALIAVVIVIIAGTTLGRRSSISSK